MSTLTNLTLTQDSDVLVYSASCNFSFPILYKLERDTGACDVITMDWLLNPGVQPNWTQPNETKQKNGGGALESILKSLVSRQSRRPGVGARLFVQACVLAGCDYCPSQLNGVGLVTAFKLVRDSAHRPAASRFEKALKTLSKKARSNINVSEYEELLAKSEAVFYYHPVLDMDSKHIIPLMTLRTTEDANESELQTFSDSHPSILRFEEDLSFLGALTSYDASPAGLKTDDDNHVAPLAEIFIPHAKPDQHKATNIKSQVASAPYDGGADAVAAVMRNVAVVNPYAKTRKRTRNDASSREPLANLGATNDGRPKPTNSTNLFQQFAHKMTAAASSQPSGRSMYVQNRQDVRFVKRNFRASPKPYAKMLSEGGPSHQQQRRQAHSRGVTSRSSSHRGTSRSNSHRQDSRSRSRGGHSSRSHVSSRGFEQDQVVHTEASLQASSYLSEGQGHEDDQQIQGPPQHAVQNIFEHEEENSFCYSEIDPANQPTTEIDMHHDPTHEPFSRQQVPTDYHELCVQEQHQGYDTTEAPFGNPDLADDGPEETTFYSTDQQSARRVTLDDADKDKALYDEFDTAATRGTQPCRPYDDDEDIDEYHCHTSNAMSENEPTRRPSQYPDDAGTSSKYFSTSAHPSLQTRPENEFDAPHINGGNDSLSEGPQDTIDESTAAMSTFGVASRLTRLPTARHANEWSSESSCEDIASPENQDKARPYFNDHGWAGRHSQVQTEVEGQPMLETFVTGATPPVQPSSPLSVTSPPRAILNIQSFPVQRRTTTTTTRGRSKKSSAHPAKRGTITQFFTPRL